AFRDADDVAASVGGIRFALRESTGDQIVQRCHHVAAVDAGASPEVSLAAGTVLVERGEHPEVISAEALGGEGVHQQSLRPRVCPTQKPRRPSCNAPQCRHGRRVYRLWVWPTTLLSLAIPTTFGGNDAHSVRTTAHRRDREDAQRPTAPVPRWERAHRASMGDAQIG